MSILRSNLAVFYCVFFSKSWIYALSGLPTALTAGNQTAFILRHFTTSLLLGVLPRSLIYRYW